MVGTRQVAAQVDQRAQPLDLGVDGLAVAANTRLSMPPIPRIARP